MTSARRNRKQANAQPNDDDDFESQADIQTHGVEVMRPYHFRSEDFARLNIEAFTDYAQYRAMGIDPERSFVRTFGTAYADIYLPQRVEAIEHNAIFRELFSRAFAAIDPKAMWSVKQSIHELLSLLNHPFTRCATKLAALKELNVMYGITMIDEQGRTTKGKALSDFYADQVPTSPAASLPSASEPMDGHPLPGSAASEHFLEKRSKGK